MQGPCLPHCYRCSPTTTLLASLALAYALSSAGYLALTRSAGTPFHDSLTPEQLAILAGAKAKRRHAFETALLASIVAVAAWRPFEAQQP